MDNSLSILLIEDEQEECQAFIQVIDPLEDVRLVGVTNNAEKALQIAQDHLPDAIILDLELHKGSGNGLSFLIALCKAQCSVSPYILVTTNNVSSITHEQARRLGADFVMVKSQADYTAESVVEFLRSIAGVIHDAHRKASALGEFDVSPTEARRRLLTQVSTEIDLIGISPKAVGRQYLIDAILLLIDGQSRNQIAVIAQKYGKTDASVERAMQNAINRTWRTADIEDLQRHYTARVSSERGIPTLTEFVYYFANKMGME